MGGKGKGGEAGGGEWRCGYTGVNTWTQLKQGQSVARVGIKKKKKALYDGFKILRRGIFRIVLSEGDIYNWCSSFTALWAADV